MLSLTKITRSEMGAYLCIASNGVPPSVSKRMKVQVHCKFTYMPWFCFSLEDDESFGRLLSSTKFTASTQLDEIITKTLFCNRKAMRF